MSKIRRGKELVRTIVLRVHNPSARKVSIMDDQFRFGGQVFQTVLQELLSNLTIVEREEEKAKFFLVQASFYSGKLLSPEKKEWLMGKSSYRSFITAVSEEEGRTKITLKLLERVELDGKVGKFSVSGNNLTKFFSAFLLSYMDIETGGIAQPLKASPFFQASSNLLAYVELLDSGDKNAKPPKIKRGMASEENDFPSALSRLSRSLDHKEIKELWPDVFGRRSRKNFIPLLFMGVKDFPIFVLEKHVPPREVNRRRDEHLKSSYAVRRFYVLLEIIPEGDDRRAEVVQPNFRDRLTLLGGFPKTAELRKNKSSKREVLLPLDFGLYQKELLLSPDSSFKCARLVKKKGGYELHVTLSTPSKANNGLKGLALGVHLTPEVVHCAVAENGRLQADFVIQTDGGRYTNNLKRFCKRLSRDASRGRAVRGGSYHSKQRHIVQNIVWKILKYCAECEVSEVCLEKHLFVPKKGPDPDSNRKFNFWMYSTIVEVMERALRKNGVEVVLVKDWILENSCPRCGVRNLCFMEAVKKPDYTYPIERDFTKEKISCSSCGFEAQEDKWMAFAAAVFDPKKRKQEQKKNNPPKN